MTVLGKSSKALCGQMLDFVHSFVSVFVPYATFTINLSVNSFCRGETLYKKIHVWCEPPSIDRNLNLANQVAQAMGYLHARGIVAKDLTTKNIFVDKGKVVITDTGLSNVTDNYWLQ